MALCAIDFAGLAYIFTLDRSLDSGREVSCLLGVWLVAAIMNASLAWWIFSRILLTARTGQGSANPSVLLKIVPVVVAVALWVIRILLIRALSAGPDRHYASQP